MRFGSVCSGIEAASTAWEPLGWEAAWFSEIEPFPCAVLKHRYPHVPNHGDMTTLPARILAGEVEAPDVLVGGTPCQSFSVAGLRQGLKDPRGQLTRTYVEICDAIDTVRAVAGKPPVVLVWENVPGVLSDRDNAFGNFLGALSGEDGALEPPGGKWTNAGLVCGPARDLAWRVLDAQYFGVAQRRRRVFLVGHSRAGSLRPVKVLLVEQGVQRHSPPSREAGQRAAAAPVTGAQGGGGGLGAGHDRGRGGVAIPLLDASKGRTDNRGSRDGSAMGQDGDPMFTLRAGSSHGVAHGSAYGFQPRISRNGRGDMGDLINALNAQSGETGKGDAAPCVAHVVAPPRATFWNGSDLAETLTATSDDQRMPDKGRMQMVVQPMDSAHNGGGLNEQDAYTGRVLPVASTYAKTHKPMSSTDPEGWSPTDSSPTITHWPRDRSDAGTDVAVVQTMAVRRLTPVECERLQGFPDEYTRIPWKNKPASECPDGPRYKALGNSMAVPCMYWIGWQIRKAMT